MDIRHYCSQYTCNDFHNHVVFMKEEKKQSATNSHETSTTKIATQNLVM